MDQTFDSKALLELFDLETDSPGLVQTLVDEYVEVSLKLINKISTAAQNGDIPKLELESHSLKSSSKVLGLYRLASVCFEIESATRERRIEHGAISQLMALRDQAIDELLAYMNSRS